MKVVKRHGSSQALNLKHMSYYITDFKHNIGRQSEHRRTAKGCILTKPQDVAEAKKALLVRKYCPHGARK